MFSWEVGFGIRLGRPRENKGGVRVCLRGKVFVFCLFYFLLVLCKG